MILLTLNAVLCGVCIVMSSRHAGWIFPALILVALLLLQSLLLLRKSRLDPLTGLYNLRHLEAMYRRYNLCRALTVYYFDLDHLKQVNDTCGHAAGDRLLMDFADSLRTGLPQWGCAFRIGGDEFLILIPSRGGYHPPARELPASWGAASGAGKDLRDLIRYAEQQMYRNRAISPETEK